MPIPGPQCNSVFPFGHNELHVTVYERPVWPIDDKAIHPSEYYISALKCKSHSQSYNGALMPCLYAVIRFITV